MPASLGFRCVQLLHLRWDTWHHLDHTRAHLDYVGVGILEGVVEGREALPPVRLQILHGERERRERY